MAQRSEADSQNEATAHLSPQPGSEATSIANAIVAGTATATTSVEHYVRQLTDPNDASAVQAARVLEAIVSLKPELLAPYIDVLLKQLGAAHGPIAECCARCLPVLARVTPAKVAKHLKNMQATLPNASEIAKDGLVRTFVALCVASVTYQKRLIDSFEMALRTAEPHQLPAWAEHILPALKGEPYAQARAIVEQRLPDPGLPREVAQRVADFLGVKLRPMPERR